ncbi:tigger transposable element-derived protein 1 [Nephila pilipes]|uniref:Tigger transposable element-derived protein 1 n=1 Tax=Nephila pilipes TaxID=299642 RepID=A0A8X6NRN9_NEPPI|nr:tigger transposable element-derived protein 1 [Nephila pilipes]
MSPKKASVKNNGEKRKVISLELKREIIDKHEQGERVIDLATQYDRSTSTICTILKQKDSIKAVTPAKGLKIISKLRNPIYDKMENLLFVWLTEKQSAGNTLAESIICEKARTIYADLLQKDPDTTEEHPQDQFKASRGWFENFKKRTGFHSGVRHGEWFLGMSYF